MSAQIAPKPRLLRRTHAAAADGAAVGVQRNEVPRADIERVITPRGITCPTTEVGEIARCVRGRAALRKVAVLVVAGNRVCNRIELSPARGVGGSDQLTAAYEKMLAKAWRLKEQGLSAAIYTQITDVETECNGLLTYDRQVIKPDVRRVNAVNTGHIDKIAE